jgi:S1-C subfamily serine protease
LIQTDAKLNLGTSGGALVNLRGEMVGLTTSIAAIAGYEQSAGYAVPMNDTFRRIIEILKDGREVEYGLLGVRSENLPPGERKPGEPGIMAGEIIDGTPAQQAGLQPSDVITHINEQPILDADSLVLELSRHFAGTPVELTVERGRRVLRMKLTLAKYPVTGRRIVTQPRPAWRGLHIDYATAVRPSDTDPPDTRGYADARGCVAIVQVDPESPAWREGLRPGMYVSHVDGRRVTTPDEFLQAVAEREDGVQLRLTLPENQNRERTIPPGA